MYEFETFEKVLVRNYGGYWAAAFFSHTEDDRYVTVGGQTWDECIPYEDNGWFLNTQCDG